MKQLNKAAGLLKAIGWALILVAAALWLYALANTGSAWSGLKDALNEAEVTEGTGIADRLAFDNRYFGALSQAASTMGGEQSERAGQVKPYFSRWFDLLRKSDAEGTAMLSANLAEQLMDEGVRAYILSRLDSVEDMQESQELREIFEYINKLAAAPAKGKKVASLQAASQEPWFAEYYAAFSQEHGEEGGTWLEFMSAVKAMMEEDAAGGATIRDAKAWMNNTFTYENYLPRLSAVREQEKAEMADNLLLALGGLYEGTPAAADFAALLRETAAAVQAKYPEQNLGGNIDVETAFYLVVPELLNDEGFDGSYAAIADALRARAASDKAESADVYETRYAGEIVKTADARAAVSIVAGFWKLVSWYLYLLLAGIALVLIALAIRQAVSRKLIRERKDAGIQEDPDVLLRVEHLKQYFKVKGGVTKAVDDISFFIKRGEVFGLVGESGCGKTTTGRTIINLYDPTEGDVYFDGLRISSSQNGLPVLKAQLRQDYQAKMAEAKKKGDAAEADRLKQELRERLRKAEDNALESAVEKSKCVELYREKRLRELKAAYEEDAKTLTGAELEARTRRYETERKVAAKDNVMTRMQMIFQDPIASINPRMTVREIIAEGLVIRGVKDKEYINQKVYEMLELVGLVREHADRYPHEFSGGQRQRIGIARAIIMEPDLIIADEPISALDVSIQAQVINLLNDLRERMGLTIMFIAHNLSVVKYFSDRIAVMYFGHIVEMATSDELFAHPLHPYTRSLLSAIPYPDPHYEKTRRRIEYNPAKAHDYSTDKPELVEITPGHWIHCNGAELSRYQRELGL